MNAWAPIRITRVDRQNLDVLDSIAEDVFDAPPTAERLDNFLNTPTQSLFVAIKNNRVVGQIKIVVHRQPEKPTSLFVEELGVGSHHRRQGIARALMAMARDYARDQGCAELWLATEPDNVPANAFYKSLRMEGQHVVVYDMKIGPEPSDP